MQWECTCLLRHHLALLSHQLLVLHHLLMELLLLLHGFEECLLLLVLHNLLPRLPEAREDFLLLIDAQSNSLALGEGDLHWPQLPLLWYQNSLLMKFGNRCLCTLERAHPYKSAPNTALCLRCNDEDFKHISKLFEAFVDLFARHFAGQPANEKLHPALLAF